MIAVRLTKEELWAAICVLDGVWESERSPVEKKLYEKLCAAHTKARSKEPAQ